MVITMTEEDFLKRWSRRKREADVAKNPAREEARDPEAKARELALASTGAKAPPAEFDPATLPPIESINALTDVTAFLRDGVPVELTRAALRRVWTADPSIRDFVGLAENAWDFTDPNAMPGFGPLESTDAMRQMIARVVDQIGESVRHQVADASQSTHDYSAVSAPEQSDTAPEEIKPVSAPSTGRPAEEPNNQRLVQSNKEDDAAQRDVTEEAANRKESFPRAHGSALPR